MITQELKDFIKKELEAGLSKEDITKKLLDTGWKQEDIDNCFSELKKKSYIWLVLFVLSIISIYFININTDRSGFGDLAFIPPFLILFIISLVKSLKYFSKQLLVIFIIVFLLVIYYRGFL